MVSVESARKENIPKMVRSGDILFVFDKVIIFFDKIIISLTFVGHEMIIANSALRASFTLSIMSYATRTSLYNC